MVLISFLTKILQTVFYYKTTEKQRIKNRFHPFSLGDKDRKLRKGHKILRKMVAVFFDRMYDDENKRKGGEHMRSGSKSNGMHFCVVLIKENCKYAGGGSGKKFLTMPMAD